MRLFYKAHYIFILAFIVIFSCSKDSTHEVKFDGDHYVKVDDIRTFEQQDILELYDSLRKIPDYNLINSIYKRVVAGVEVKRLRYQTTLEGNDIVASGLLCYPDDYSGTYPILCFHNGTNVLHDKAPSENYEDDLFILLESLASLGFVVVMPDYPGFGVSDYRTHPYLIKDETVPASRDILLATQEYFDEVNVGIELNNDLFLMGYSMGAWATLQLQREIELEGLSTFNLIASSCGSGPYSISKLFGELNEKRDSVIQNPYFIAYMMHAYKEYGLIDTLGLSDIFNEPYASRIPDLFNGRNTPQAINDSLSNGTKLKVSELINEAYLDGIDDLENPTYLPVREAFAKNDVEGWSITTPTTLFFGAQDKTVPPKITADMVSKLNNSPIVNDPSIGNFGHTEALVPFGLATLYLWFIHLNYFP